MEGALLFERGDGEMAYYLVELSQGNELAATTIAAGIVVPELITLPYLLFMWFTSRGKGFSILMIRVSHK